VQLFTALVLGAALGWPYPAGANGKEVRVGDDAMCGALRR